LTCRLYSPDLGYGVTPRPALRSPSIGLIVGEIWIEGNVGFSARKDHTKPLITERKCTRVASSFIDVAFVCAIDRPARG
jgi:hypothetical protein